MSEKNKGTPFPRCFATALLVAPLVLVSMVLHLREAWRESGLVGR